MADRTACQHCKNAIDSVVQLICDQAAVMAEMAISGIPENSRNREAMEAAFTRIVHIIRASRAVATDVNAQGSNRETLEKGCPNDPDHDPKNENIASGIELAARFVDRRRDDYVREHGSYDGSTGMTEFPGNGEEYVYELEEIAEGIRALAAPTSSTGTAPSSRNALSGGEGDA